MNSIEHKGRELFNQVLDKESMGPHFETMVNFVQELLTGNALKLNKEVVRDQKAFLKANHLSDLKISRASFKRMCVFGNVVKFADTYFNKEDESSAVADYIVGQFLPEGAFSSFDRTTEKTQYYSLNTLQFLHGKVDAGRGKKFDLNDMWDRFKVWKSTIQEDENLHPGECPAGVDESIINLIATNLLSGKLTLRHKDYKGTERFYGNMEGPVESRSRRASVKDVFSGEGEESSGEKEEVKLLKKNRLMEAKERFLKTLSERDDEIEEELDPKDKDFDPIMATEEAMESETVGSTPLEPASYSTERDDPVAAAVLDDPAVDPVSSSQSQAQIPQSTRVNETEEASFIDTFWSVCNTIDEWTFGW